MSNPTSLSQEEIAATVKEYILQQYLPGEDPQTLTQTTSLYQGGVLDSLSTLKLVEFLEKQFQITVQPHEVTIDNLDTLAEISRFVVSKRA